MSEEQKTRQDPDVPRQIAHLEEQLASLNAEHARVLVEMSAAPSNRHAGYAQRATAIERHIEGLTARKLELEEQLAAGTHDAEAQLDARARIPGAGDPALVDRLIANDSMITFATGMLGEAFRDTNDIRSVLVQEAYARGGHNETSRLNFFSDVQIRARVAAALSKAGLDDLLGSGSGRDHGAADFADIIARFGSDFRDDSSSPSRGYDNRDPTRDHRGRLVGLEGSEISGRGRAPGKER